MFFPPIFHVRSHNQVWKKTAHLSTLYRFCRDQRLVFLSKCLMLSYLFRVSAIFFIRSKATRRLAAVHRMFMSQMKASALPKRLRIVLLSIYRWPQIIKRTSFQSHGDVCRQRLADAIFISFFKLPTTCERLLKFYTLATDTILWKL